MTVRMNLAAKINGRTASSKGLTPANSHPEPGARWRVVMRAALMLICIAMLPVFAFGQTDPLSGIYKPAVDCTPTDYPPNIALSGPLVKLRQDSGSPSGVYGAAPCLTFYAVQNEFQSFQVHVQAPSGGYAALSVTISSLAKTTGPGGNYTIPAPSSAATNIVPYEELYMNVTIPTGTSATFYGTTGRYPDALLPVIDPYYHQTTTAASVVVAAGANQSYWVDVLVPQTAPAGWYQGSVTVKNGSTTIATFPVLLGVWQWPSASGGYMPSKATLWSMAAGSYSGGCIQMFGGLANCTYDGTSGGDGSTRLVQLDTISLLLDNRYTDAFQSNVFVGSSGDFTTFDSTMGPYLNGTSGTHVAQVLPGAALTTMWPEDMQEGPNPTIWQNYRTHFNAKGWGNALFNYLCDEPSPQGGGTPITTCITNGLTDHTYATPVVPNVVTGTASFVSQYPNGLSAIDWLFAAVNIFAPIGGPQEPVTDYTGWLAGEPSVRRWGMYQACGSAGTCSSGLTGGTGFTYPNYDVDGLPVANRAMEWNTFRVGATGELYYYIDVCAATTTPQAQQCGVYNGGPTTSPLNPFVSNYYSGGWGDGTLIYYTGTAYNAGTTIPLILPSMRLKMIRDGVQDYEYLYLLTNQGKGSFVQSEIASWMTNTYTFNLNPSGLMSARQALGQAIHQLTYPAVLPPQSVSGALQ